MTRSYRSSVRPRAATPPVNGDAFGRLPDAEVSRMTRRGLLVLALVAIYFIGAAVVAWHYGKGPATAFGLGSGLLLLAIVPYQVVTRRMRWFEALSLISLAVTALLECWRSIS